MLIENLTEKNYVLDLGVRLRALDTTSVSDALYQANTLLNGEIDALRQAGKVAIHGEQAVLTIPLGDQKLFQLVAVAEGAAGNGITLTAFYQHPLDEQDSELTVNVIGTDIVVELEAQGFEAEIPLVPAVPETKSSLVKGAGNARITFTASGPVGTAGDAVHVVAEQATDPDIDDGVITLGGVVSITLGTDGLGDPLGTSAADIATLLALDTDTFAVVGAVATPGTGADPFLAFTDTPLAGGVDAVPEVPAVPQVDAHNTTTVQALYDQMVLNSDVTDLVTPDFLGPTDTLFPPTDETQSLEGGGDIPSDTFPDGATDIGSGRISFRLEASQFGGWEATDDPNLFLYDTGLRVPETGGFLDDTLAIQTSEFSDTYAVSVAYMTEGNEATTDRYEFDGNTLNSLGSVFTDIDQSVITANDMDGQPTPGRIVLILDTSGANVPGVRPDPNTGAFIIWTGVWI